MGFWSFLRDLFVFDWLSGNHRKGGTPTNHINNYDSEDYCHNSQDDYAYDFDDFEDDF